MKCNYKFKSNPFPYFCRHSVIFIYLVLVLRSGDTKKTCKVFTQVITHLQRLDTNIYCVIPDPGSPLECTLK